MRLIRLIIHNFMSFAGEQVVTLDSVGLVRIEGENRDDSSVQSNGAAKSAIVDALYWCFYGITTHEPTAEGDEVINRRIKKNCLVEGFFEQNGKHHVVRRGRKCSGDYLKKLGCRTGLFFQVEDESLTSGTVIQTQQQINNTLGLTRDTFRHSVIFGQSKAYRFSRLGDAGRKAILDELLGVEVYARAARLAAERLHEVGAALVNVRSALSHAEERFASHRAGVEGYQQLEANFEDEKKETIETAKSELKEIKSTARASKKLSSSLEALRAAESRLNETTTELEAELMSLSEDRSRAHTAKKQSEVDAGELLEKTVRVSERGFGVVCPECNSKLDASHVKRHLTDLHKSYKAQKLKIRNWERKMKRADNDITWTRVKHKNNKKAQRKHACKVTDAVAAERSLTELGRRERKAREALERGERKVSPYRRLSTERKMKATHAELIVMRSEEELETLELRKAQLEFWREAFGARGLRSLMLDSALPFLNARVEQYANRITAGTIAIEFKAIRELKKGTTKDEFHVAVHNQHGADSYKMNSIGERAKIDLCVGLALQDMAAQKSRARVNVAFFDEPFEGLDDVALDRVMDMLTSVLRERESVFVITHQDALKSYIAKSIKVIKEDGCSVIEE